MDQIIQDILAQEEGILECMQTYFCDVATYLTPTGPDETADVEDKVEVVKSFLCAMSSKERAIANVLDGSAYVLLADKGISPNSCGSIDPNCCGC